MALRVNQTSLRKAQTFIRQGKIDATSSWSFSAADGNKLLGPDDDWKNYASFHLAEDTGAEEETKARYKYPWGKNDKIYRRGVIAIKARASAQGETAIAGAADSLLQAIDKKLGKEDTRLEEIKGDLLQNNFRIDCIEYDVHDCYLEESFQETPEGYLKGRAIFTNIGVFPYLLEDGNVRWELRPPQEVFNYESVKSFQLLPMTNEHPEGLVNSANIKDVQIGYSGEDIKTSAYHLAIPMVITDEVTVDECKSKVKRALSAGYTVDIELTEGVWMGVPYDAIQRNIRGNHIAIVDRGRAGDDAVMKFDSVDSVGILQTNYKQAQNLNTRRDSMGLKKKRIDGVEYEADQKIIDLLSAANTELEKVKADYASALKNNEIISAERDQLKETNDKLKADIASVQKINPKEFEAAVQQRLVVLDAAKRAQVEIKKDMTEEDIKKAVILVASPSAKEKLDNCGKDYLQARFDGALEVLDSVENNSSEENNPNLKGDTIGNKDNSKPENKYDSRAAYDRMVENMQNSSERKKEVN
jgi:hypothetical protein